MAIDLNNGYTDLHEHLGHDIECVSYGDGQHYGTPEHAPANVAIECTTCGQVLIDFDRPEDADDRSS